MAKKKVKINIVNLKKVEVEEGMSLKNLVKDFYKGKEKVFGATVDNKHRTLDFEIKKDSEIEFLTYSTTYGKEIYKRSLSFILIHSVRELYKNGRLEIHHSLGNAFYYDLTIDIPVGEKVVNQIKDKMNEVIKSGKEFERFELLIKDAIELFRKEGYFDKVRLLENVRNLDKVALYKLGDYIDINYGPLVPDASYIDIYDLKQYNAGILLCFPDPVDPKTITPQKYHTKLFDIYQESKKWTKILEITNVGRLNQIIKNSDISDYIKINEVLHEKKISAIADEITKKSKEVRIILIAGPSSSGKTTFSKRVKTHLQVNGLFPVTISLDDYFVNREDNPKDEDGNFDFESIHSLDLKLLNKHMVALLKGEEVPIPKFDFTKGKRSKEVHPLRINENQIIIIEGIHGLNDELTSAIDSKNKYKIYISPLTQLCLDDYNRISTTDCRLIRRMVRDHQFRNYPASETLDRWASVRRGEEINIFPFQESADIMFNSSLFYEIPVLKKFAVPLLEEITRDDKNFAKADSLLKFLSLFKSAELSIEEIPPTSLLREFIGGSSFKY
ncbi:MAG: nucleoside kinase [Candidatus Muiribacteriota bacterium]